MSFYELSFKTPSGKEVSMSEYKGKTVLIVNTATKCGLTPQFEGLEKLHQDYREKGLVVLGFPCAQFLGQEPETNETLEEVCKVNHGVSFQLSEKVDVNGSKTHSVYKWLKRHLKGGFFSSRIKWNFTKFLVGPDGTAYKRYAPTVQPLKIKDDIEILLGK